MTFEEKLKNVSELFTGLCSSFIVIGENLILTNKCLDVVSEQREKGLEKVKEYFSITDLFAEHLTAEYREAFDTAIQIGTDTFYIASVWEGRIFLSLSIINGIRGYDWRWVDKQLNTLLCRLAWTDPLSQHDVAIKANYMFGSDLYGIYDIMPFYGWLTDADWSKEDVVKLIVSRYISINALPLDVLEGICETVDECDLMEHDIVSLFNCKMELTEKRIRKLKVSDIAKARVLAIKAFENEMAKLIGEEEQKDKEEARMYGDCMRPEEAE